MGRRSLEGADLEEKQSGGAESEVHEVPLVLLSDAFILNFKTPPQTVVVKVMDCHDYFHTVDSFRRVEVSGFFFFFCLFAS